MVWQGCPLLGGHIMRKLLALALVLSFASGSAYAATPKPTIKVKTKVVTPTAKASPSATKKASAPAKAPAKATAKAPATATTKSPAKATPKKTSTQKKVKKVVRLTPPPTQKWPPQGFYTDNKDAKDVYARFPTKKELNEFSSAHPSLTARLQECLASACGVIQVASFYGCTWWEVTGTLYETPGAGESTRKALGKLQTLLGASKPQQVMTVLLISREELSNRHYVDDYSVVCRRDPPTENIPQYLYQPLSG